LCFFFGQYVSDAQLTITLGTGERARLWDRGAHAMLRPIAFLPDARGDGCESNKECSNEVVDHTPLPKMLLFLARCRRYAFPFRRSGNVSLGAVTIDPPDIKQAP
jgi:hypothetical protein